jgi:hypothetical protein
MVFASFDPFEQLTAKASALLLRPLANSIVRVNPLCSSLTSSATKLSFVDFAVSRSTRWRAHQETALRRTCIAEYFYAGLS